MALTFENFLQATTGHVECCRVLLECNAHVQLACEYDGDTPLHRAVRLGHAPVVTLLLQHGACKLQKNAQGHTPLQQAETRKTKAQIMQSILTFLLHTVLHKLCKALCEMALLK
jgi:ankyrin repeat protein